MTILPSVKKRILPVLIIILSVSIVAFQSCKKKRSAIAGILFKKTHIKVLKDFSPEDFSLVFKKVLDSGKIKVAHRNIIRAYYQQNDYKPEFLIDHLFNNDLLAAADYFEKANEHGLDTALFKPGQIRAVVEKFKAKGGIKT